MWPMWKTAQKIFAYACFIFGMSACGTTDKPPIVCLGNNFLTSRLAEIKVNAQMYNEFNSSGQLCGPTGTCGADGVIAAGSPVVVHQIASEKWACIGYTPKSHQPPVLQRVVLLKNIRFLDAPQNPVGQWVFGPQVVVIRGQNSVKIRGKAEFPWYSDHTKNIIKFAKIESSSTWVPKNKLIKFLSRKCKVLVRPLGPYLMVQDNKKCGGQSVTFTGAYRRITDKPTDTD